MYDRVMLGQRLLEILTALERIPDRFTTIASPDDFTADAHGLEHMDAICMVLIAVGEAFRQIDRKTGAAFLSGYPQVPWREVMGVRNVLAHGYFDVDPEQIFSICRDNIPSLIATVRRMIEDMNHGPAS